MSYKQAMGSADLAEWWVEVDKEHDRMVKNDRWDVVPKASAPLKTKIFNSVSAMRSKADGFKCMQLNIKGCSQVVSNKMMQTISHHE
jgi:hypothetical protein